MLQFGNKFFISDSLQIPTKGPSLLYIEPVKQALQTALLAEERGDFTELPNGIVFKRGHVAQRYAKNHFNAFDSLCLTVEANDHGVIVNYKLGLMNAVRDFALVSTIIVVMLLVLPTLRGLLLAVLIAGLAYAIEVAVYRSLELRARAWLERVAQVPAGVAT